jgi:hypothetical protein
LSNERMASLLDKVTGFFRAQPCPSLVFQLSPSYLSGIQVAVKERKIKNRAVLRLPPGLVEPHFDRPNISDGGVLAGLMEDGLKGFLVSGGKIACLIPESCFRIFVLSLASFPDSEREREKLILWRAKKQVPVLPEDARLAYEITPAAGGVKVLAALARAAVVGQYEALFAGLGLKVGIVTAPTLSLLNLVDWTEEKDLIVTNVEDDSISLVAVINSELTLHRSKPLVNGDRQMTPGQYIENVIREIENTVHFIEDREKRSIRSIWLRSSPAEREEAIISELSRRFAFSVKPVEAPHLAGIPSVERPFLVPLAGQIP